MINVKETRKREREWVRQTKRKGAMVSGLTGRNGEVGRKQGLKGGNEREGELMCGRGEHACTSSLLFSAGGIRGPHKRLSESYREKRIRYSPPFVRFLKFFFSFFFPILAYSGVFLDRKKYSGTARCNRNDNRAIYTGDVERKRAEINDAKEYKWYQSDRDIMCTNEKEKEKKKWGNFLPSLLGESAM